MSGSAGETIVRMDSRHGDVPPDVCQQNGKCSDAVQATPQTGTLWVELRGWLFWKDALLIPLIASWVSDSFFISFRENEALLLAIWSFRPLITVSEILKLMKK
jgi:hypothetical protein